MGKHLLTRADRIKRARAFRKIMNRKHHTEATKATRTETFLMNLIGSQNDKETSRKFIENIKKQRAKHFEKLLCSNELLTRAGKAPVRKDQPIFLGQ